MNYEQKYGYKGAIPFVGRLMVTLNDDPVSLGILPDTDQSLLDKVLLLKTDDIEVDVADTEEERYAIIDRELPAFVRWISDLEIPERLGKDSQFGMKAFHDGEVLEEARSVTTSATALEVVEMWRSRRTEGQTEAVRLATKPWEGTTSQLLMAMLGDEELEPLARRLTPVGLGRYISQAVSSGSTSWISHKRRSKDKAKILVIQP